MNLINWLRGKKTYFLALALFAYTIGGYLTGHMTAQEALALIYSSGVIASLRAAISKVPPSIPPSTPQS
jgi:hypothetical protein